MKDGLCWLAIFAAEDKDRAAASRLETGMVPSDLERIEPALERLPGYPGRWKGVGETAFRRSWAIAQTPAYNFRNTLSGGRVYSSK